MANDDAAPAADVRGWLLFGAFGLLWTLGLGFFAVLVVRDALQPGSDPLNLGMVGVLAAMFSLGPAALYVSGSELFGLFGASARRRKYPDSRWKWTPRWDGGVARADAAGEAFWAWYGGTALALFLVPFLVQLMIVKPDWRAIILLPFFGLNFWIFRFAWRRTRSAGRFGRLALRLSHLPIQPGTEFDVALELPVRLEGQASVRLSCQRRVSSGRGQQRKARVEMLYELTKQVPVVPSGSGSLIRTTLGAPSREWGSEDGGRDRASWWVDVTLPGNLSESFEIPVFKIAADRDVERFSLPS